MSTFAVPLPRIAFALCASALSLLTLGTLVVLPAHFDGGHASANVAAANFARATPADPIEVAIVPARVDVTAVREPNVAWAMGGPAQPNCKPDV